MKKIIYTLFFLSFSSLPFGEGWGGAFAQDIHFSQFFSSPLNLNPALTGVFNGNVRFVGNYRNQWSPLNGYKTISASVDAGLFRERFRNKDFVGAGIVFFSDKAGDGNFGTTQVNACFSYNKALGRDGKQYLALGVLSGLSIRSVDDSKLTWDSQYDGNEVANTTLPSNEAPIGSYNFINLNAGLLWYAVPSKKLNLNAGLILNNILTPNQSFLKVGSNNLFPKFGIHAGSQITLKEHLWLLPSLLVKFQGPQRETNVGTFFKYQMAENVLVTPPSIYFGVWHRFKDAVNAVLRFDYSILSIGISYDINTSKLNDASNSQGGPEIALIIILPAQTNNKKGNKLSCPSF